MELTGLNIAIIAALLLVIVSIAIRVIWLAQTKWGEVLSAMTITDWLLTATIVPLVIWLQLKQ